MNGFWLARPLTRAPRGALCWASLALVGLLPSAASAGEIAATPATIGSLLPTLKPGDTLTLAAGTYKHFTVSGLNGTEQSRITIRGPAQGPPAVIEADKAPCCNTIELVNSSHVAIEHLTIDGGGVEGAFGVSAKGATNVVHHIRIEGCTFVKHDASQQTVAISTKTPTWGWIVRGNVIDGAGTGLYLGNSDGSAPFVDGVIEGNLIRDTVGYNAQIKFQDEGKWPQGSAIPAGPTRTHIRHNVFLKTDRPSPDGPRPNLLVGGQTASGPGAQNSYEIYANVFVHNKDEPLLQASGRVSVHDNLFVDALKQAVLLQNHDKPLTRAWAYNNTVYGKGKGIVVNGTPAEGDHIVGNLLFTDDQGIGGSPKNTLENLLFKTGDAPGYVVKPGLALGDFDFYPLAGKVEGSPLDLSVESASDVAWDRDFNATPKGTFTFRGAYTGAGKNPGWIPQDALPTIPDGQGGSGGSGQGGSAGSAQAGSGGSPQAGSGGSPQAGSGGSAAGSGQGGGAGGSGQGGSAQAGQGGSAGSAGSGNAAGSASAGGSGNAGGSSNAGSGGNAQAGSAGAAAGGGAAGKGGSSAGGQAGAQASGGGQSGGASADAQPGDDDGCGCRAVGRPPTGAGAALAVLALLASCRRRGRGARWSDPVVAERS